MKIFLPFQKDLNPYLDEITGSSVNTFVYDSWKNYDASYPIVNVHWPEAIFGWKEPTKDELKDLEQAIDSWKKYSVLVYTKHDFQRNKGTTENFRRLFELIEEKADAFIHLGKYSKSFYERKYPNAIHRIIYHPLYLNSFDNPDKEMARERLRIDKDAMVIIVPGNIRKYKERDMVLNAFNSLGIKNKVLICTNVHAEIRYDFPGRIRLKKFVDIKKRLVNSFKEKHRPPRYIFSYNFIPQEELELKMAAADVVIIPRINSLNSGILFLGITFGKIVTGPKSGNIWEQLEDLDFPLFDPEKPIEVVKAMEKAISMANAGEKPGKKKLNKYQPKKIAQEMDSFFHFIIDL